MALQDLTDVIDRVWYWINRSDEKVPAKIAAAYKQKGGWEGWAQVEIAYLVEEKYPHVTIDREVNVYAGTKKENDFVITDDHDATKPKQIIELKTERGTQTPADFQRSFLADITKIWTSPIDAKYKPAQAFAVAISCTQESHDLLKFTEVKEDPGPKIIRVECNKGIYIWWYKKDIV